MAFIVSLLSVAMESIPLSDFNEYYERCESWENYTYTVVCQRSPYTYVFLAPFDILLEDTEKCLTQNLETFVSR